ncbi:MAG TPA: CPBP family intramembrane metalloprotease [Opitutaceae bacterium]|nr:CPBP family intramembrane metalloprotease [Opitutaceae bacterium]
MPAVSTQLVMALELILVFAGCVLLWRHGLSPEARRQPALLARWDISPGNFLLFLWLVITVGLLAQFAAVPALRRADWGETATVVLAGGAFHVGMLLGALLFSLITRKPEPVPGPAAVTPALIPAAGATFLILLPLITAASLGWQFVLARLGLEAAPQDLVGMFLSVESPWLLAAMILLATVVAPVSEELVFRAGLFRYLRGRGPRWVAFLLPAMLFAALHANLASFVPLTVLGMLFALAYERTGRLAVPIVAHGLFNLNTIMLLFAGVAPGA